MITSTPKLSIRQIATSCGDAAGRDDGAEVLTIEIRAIDAADILGLLSEVRKAVKAGKRGGDLQFCAGAARYAVTNEGERAAARTDATLALAATLDKECPDCEEGDAIKAYCALCEGAVYETCKTCKGSGMRADEVVPQ